MYYKLQLQLHEVSPSDSPHVHNCAKAWDEDSHPWIDLADVKITTLLANDVIERTKYNISNTPASLSVVGPPESIYDFRCIPYYRQRAYKQSQKMRLLRGPPHHDDNCCSYVIKIETGDVKYAGTDANITLTMTGTFFEFFCVLLFIQQYVLISTICFTDCVCPLYECMIISFKKFLLIFLFYYFHTKESLGIGL